MTAPTSPAISDACKRHSALEVELCRQPGCNPRCDGAKGLKPNKRKLYTINKRPLFTLPRCYCRKCVPPFHAHQHGEESKSCPSSRTTEEFFG